MIIDLIIILLIIISLILSSLKLFTHVFDKFENDIYTNCEDITDSLECIDNVNCRLYNVGGSRNLGERCGQSAAAAGAFGNPNVI